MPVLPAARSDEAAWDDDPAERADRTFEASPFAESWSSTLPTAGKWPLILALRGLCVTATIEAACAPLFSAMSSSMPGELLEEPDDMATGVINAATAAGGVVAARDTSSFGVVSIGGGATCDFP